MELEQAIRNRRSIRKFSKQKISKPELEKVLYHGTLAPSAHNLQHWRFVVIQDNQSLKDKVVDTMLNKYQEMIINGEDTGSIKNTAEIIKEAPVFIAILNGKSDNSDIPSIQSIGACIQNICLSAYDLGIGSLWICDVDCCYEEIEKLLGVTDAKLVAGLSLGYAEEKPSPRPRLTVEEVTSWY